MAKNSNNVLDENKKVVVAEDYPITHVPQSARRSFFSVAAV